MPDLPWQYPPRSGNRLRLYLDGDAAFAAAYDAIRSARERVWLEMYIFEPDEVGRMARDALAEAAERGCDVILLFDRWGSPRFSLRYARPILEAGGRVAVYNPLLPWRKIGRKLAPLLHRDHRKILITDDRGFVGGRNISRAYGGPGPEDFIDLTLEVQGPGVQDLALTFCQALRRATDDAPDLTHPTPARNENAIVQVLPLDYRHREQDLDRALREGLETVRAQCLLMTPYFIPPLWFRTALIQAAERGVEVRVLTAGKSDVPLARVAGRHLYGPLLQSGIHIYEMLDPILHAKSITLDNRHAIVGSYNMDTYGGKHNMEVGVAFSEPALVNQLDATFFTLLDRARPIALDAWKARSIWSKTVSRLLYRLFSL